MRGAILMVIFAIWLNATPLHDAVKRLDTQKVKVLTKECKDINAQDKYGNTPLHLAVRIGRVSIIRELLKCKPNMKIKNRDGNTPLAIAIAKNRISTVNMLLGYQQKQAFKPKQNSAIYETIVKDDIKSFKIFIQLGLDVNNKDKNGVTLLDIAAKHRAKKIAAYLLQNGADVTLKDKENRDALYYARYGGDREIIDMIRKKIK